MCPACGLSLTRSVYDGEFKSCPKCSRVEGRHAYYRLETFGERELGGRIIPQSWCSDCRGGELGAPTRLCSGSSNG